MNKTTKKAFSIMDEVVRQLNEGEIDRGLTFLDIEMTKLRHETETEVWEAFAQEDFLSHPLLQMVLQDPFTKHSFDKPRNYSGDAELIDYMYGLRKPHPEIEEFSHKLFDYTTNSPAPQSVRERRTIIASMIDELAEDNPNLRILSVACGHLREASVSEAVQNLKVADFFALDQDEMSLEVVKNELSRFNVRPVQAPIKSLLTNGHEFQNLDFVYSAGLYDYLTQPVATKLTTKMFQMLKPGGKLLVANFAPCLRDIGYMETFMQWKLIYRNEDEVLDLARRIPKDEIASQRLFWDQAGNVIYLEIIKQ